MTTPRAVDMPGVATELAALRATVAGLALHVEGVGKDAREARDATIQIKATLSSENLSSRIEAARAEAQGDINALRSDTVHAIGVVTDRIERGEGRLGAVEGKVSQLEGAHSSRSQLVSFLFSALAAVAAAGSAIFTWIGLHHHGG